jgi:hypothetical protein
METPFGEHQNQAGLIAVDTTADVSHVVARPAYRMHPVSISAAYQAEALVRSQIGEDVGRRKRTEGVGY